MKAGDISPVARLTLVPSPPPPLTVRVPSAVAQAVLGCSGRFYFPASQRARGYLTMSVGFVVDS